MSPVTKRRVVTWVVGAAVGAVVGAIVAVNLVIFSGIDQGYEATLPEVFDENIVVGILVLAVLIAGPVLGAIVALRNGTGPPTPLS